MSSTFRRQGASASTMITPGNVKPEDLRSDVGFLLEGKELSRAGAIMTRIKVRMIGQRNYAVAAFPIKSKMSYMMGAMRVYPVLGKYMQMKGYKMTPAIEIYDTAAKKI